jgi:hypothetical protein
MRNRIQAMWRCHTSCMCCGAAIKASLFPDLCSGSGCFIQADGMQSGENSYPLLHRAAEQSSRLPHASFTPDSLANA